MNIRRLPNFYLFVTFVASSLLFSPNVHAQQVKTLDGMVQIERNNLYMIPVGSNEGLIKGDIVEIYRLDVKVAEARLISVLSDSSMIEMTKFININDVFESDTVKYESKRDAVPRIRQTLKSEPTSVLDSDDADIAVSLKKPEARGLLGSQSSIKEEILEAKAPLQMEATGLKKGLESLKQEYEEKMEAILETTKGSQARSVVRLDEKWRRRFNETTADYEKKLAEQRAALEAEYAREKEELEKQIDALTDQISVAGEVTDKKPPNSWVSLKVRGKPSVRSGKPLKRNGFWKKDAGWRRSTIWRDDIRTN